LSIIFLTVLNISFSKTVLPACKSWINPCLHAKHIRLSKITKKWYYAIDTIYSVLYNKRTSNIVYNAYKKVR